MLEVIYNLWGMERLFKDFKMQRALLAGFQKQKTNNGCRQIQFYNFWPQPLSEMYWSRWFEARPYLLQGHYDLTVGFFSVFGSRELIKYTNCDINVFYSAENLKNEFYWQYSDSFLNEEMIDFSMGFEDFEHDRYCRFPNWMDVFFLRQEDVPIGCNRLRFPDVSRKCRYAALICSHDGGGLRTSMLEGLEQYGNVSCAGKYRHNDDTLKGEYNDDKMEYLKQFCFNICPENTNAWGYVTEKVFQAISSGCIPVYWGSCNRPEPDVLNKDAIVFWKPGEDNRESLSLIEDLTNNPKMMKEFLSQPRLLPTAEEYISDHLSEVESKISSLIERCKK